MLSGRQFRQNIKSQRAGMRDEMSVLPWAIGMRMCCSRDWRRASRACIKSIRRCRYGRPGSSHLIGGLTVERRGESQRAIARTFACFPGSDTIA
jgi:hypothetical protein